jgi:CheY-like chemotaxis protein
MKLDILVAANPEGHRRLSAILSGHHLTFVQTMDEAQSVLASKAFDLIVIGTRFDESRMFELVRHAKSSGKSSGTCVVCFRGILGRHPKETVVVEGLLLGCQALGAASFHDFVDYPDDPAGNRAIREIFESYART